MNTKLVRIGNSRSIRIPERLSGQCGQGDTVELRVENGCLLISTGRRPLQGWEEAFRAAGPAAEDGLLRENAD